jgi:UDP-2,4-diacetamido-2,4,6-trideoxy-beta-L-altropyranose hydrolase
MNIVVRVDASTQIGTGHFMRCLTLAAGFKQRGAQVRFVSRHMPEYLRDMLNAKGHEFVPLNSIPSEKTADDGSYAHWLGVSQAQDATDTCHALSDQTWDWLVVDHYALDVRWETVLRNAVERILVIDDIADRQHDCDVLLDQNFYTDMDIRYTGKVPAHCQLLLGPRYALLREEFRRIREQINPRTGPVKHALVFFGGVDPDNYTSRAIEALASIGSHDLHVDVVIGVQHPHRKQIETACVYHDFVCHVQTDQIAELMAAADLAIGAGGSATWERCCLGLPTLTVCVADNQRKQITDAASAGMLYAPEVEDELILVFKRHVIALMENGCLRHAISHNGMQAVDGRGVDRVIGSLGCSGVDIRIARHDDAEKLFEWRNHPTVRAFSRSADMITWESHQKWFASVLTSPDRLLLIGQIGEVPVGVVRFDMQSDEAEVSIYLVPNAKIPCQGRDLLRSAERWFMGNRPEVRKICAHVLAGNARSQHIFLGTGYQVEFTRYSKMIH